jgi:uncharacterized protein involved in exopolysaccharide biosynthesis
MSERDGLLASAALDGRDGLDRGAEDEGFGPYVALLRRRPRVLIYVPIAVAIITGIILFLMPREYLAEASFVANEPPSGASKLGNLTSALTGGASSLLSGMSSALSPSTNADFFAALLDSRELLHDVVITQYKSTRPNGFNGDLVKYFKIHRPTRNESEIAAIKPTRKRITAVGIDIRTGIVTISVTTKDPDLSLQVNRRMLELVNQFNVKRLQDQASAEEEFANRRSQEAKDDLSKAEQALAAFDEQNRSVIASPRLQIERSALQRRIEIAEGVYLELVQEFDESRIDALRNTPLIAVVSNPEGLVEPLRKQIPEKSALAALGTLILCALIIMVVDRKHLHERRDDAPGGRRVKESMPLAAD